MACIASTFTGSVAALKASKVQVRIAARSWRPSQIPELLAQSENMPSEEKTQAGRAEEDCVGYSRASLANPVNRLGDDIIVCPSARDGVFSASAREDARFPEGSRFFR